jgi:cytochrome c oxidase subunit 2
MHIHKFERFWINLSFVLIGLFIATVVYGFVAMDLKVIGNYQTIDPQNLGETPFGKTGVREVTKNGMTEYEVYVQTIQFAFLPGTSSPIVVPANTRVTFYITSPDVLHGFEVVGTNLNTMTIPGQVSKFTTIFPEVREYGIICNEYCGPAHHVMEGKIKVVPKSEFDKSNLIE